SIYQDLKSKTVQQMQYEIQTNKAILEDLNEQTAKALLHAFQKDTLKELLENEIITVKLYVMLNKEFNR
ncbi:MAG: hypothetical protein KAI44_02285, partial [Methylococcales bacterium]|nr:hypothetical protein [Methylococcales bacterium]